jgi:hypothetical protein
MTTLIDRLHELHPKVAAFLELVDSDDLHPLSVGMIVNSIAGIVLFQMAHFELPNEADAKLAQQGRDLLELAERARDELLVWKLTEARRR